ncbi:YigZ family protein [Candidatus Methylopumilus universalis]|uniref:IMPACT family protein n=1 Tax=Candidatus Methylopumilus universalis TaxID=2588536 RepID=UPI0011229C3D|nr:YigZ family protein [Candidatus Methylopumilus universalis]QDC70589.1 YigZ family protein [Candidatus Methylopumilus universalis]
MNCFKSISTQEQTIQKSRFIGYTFIGETKQDILRTLQSIAKEHPHASHLAFAYQLKTEHGFEPCYSDAGEPSGTAGKPLLQLIDAHQIVGGGIGVIRYYGGINLGTGGLTRAYGGTGKLALTHSTIEAYVEYIKLKLSINYNELDNYIHVIHSMNGSILDKGFAEKVSLLVKLPETQLGKLKERFPMTEMNRF